MKHAWLYAHLLEALKGESLSSGFSTDGSLISASAAPHCGIKAWSRSVFSHTCYAYCQESLPCEFMPFWPSHLHFFFQNLSRVFPVLAVADTGSCVGPHNKIGHPAHSYGQLMQVPVLSAGGISVRSKTCVFIFPVLRSEWSVGFFVKYLSEGYGYLWYYELWNE